MGHPCGHQPRAAPAPVTASFPQAQRCEAEQGCGAVTAGGEGWQPPPGSASISLQGSRGAAARRQLQLVLVADGCCCSRALGWCLQAARAPQPGCQQRPGLLLWVSAPRACRARGPQSPKTAVLPSRGEGLSRWLGSQHRASPRNRNFLRSWQCPLAFSFLLCFRERFTSSLSRDRLWARGKRDCGGEGRRGRVGAVGAW